MVKSSNFGSARSRKKNPNPKNYNYNYVYNSGLKPNNFLKKHPFLKRVGIQPERNYVQSFVAATDLSKSRASLSTVGGRAIAGTPEQYILQSYIIVEETTNIELGAQSFEDVLNESEDGEILAIECITNSSAVTVEVVTYGLGNSPTIINSYSIIEMLRRGRGMTPAEVETLPNGRGKDPSGRPRRYYPYIARYKDDNLADHLGDSRRWFAFIYEPAVSFPYSSIIVNLKNTSTQSNKMIDSINIHRRVYGSPVTNEVRNALEFDSTIIYEQQKEQLQKQLEQERLANITSETASPYITNLDKRIQEREEEENSPEIIASDDI